MNTKTSPCIVKFVGGPSDGLVLSDSHFEAQDKLRLPATPEFVRCGQHSCRERVGHWSATYSLTSRERTVEGGQPTACLRYDFVGYELLKTQAECASEQQDSPQRMVAVRSWFANLRRKFVDWMLEPTDYPLKLPLN